MKVPLRMCVATRVLKPKNELFRLVKTKDGIVIDLKQKMQARGVFVSKDKEVIKTLRKSKCLNKAFKTNVDERVFEELEMLCQEQN